jgi:hypothetical protein
MIGEVEAGLWRQAVESADALEVYVDWLLIHDPTRGELVRRRMQNGELTDSERVQERRSWLKALGLDGFQVCEHIACEPLPRRLTIDAQQMAPLEPVLDQLPFLHIELKFLDIESYIAAAFASPAMAKIRALSFEAISYAGDDENYQSYTMSYFGERVVTGLCSSPNITQLEVLWLGCEPGPDSAKLIAAVPFVGLRELSFYDAPIGDDGVIAIATSPIVKTLRRISLYDSEIGDAGAWALASAAQLQELSIIGHRIGPAAATALREMPSLKRIQLAPDV